MNWITDDIAIGNHREARDVALLKHHGIRSVLSLDGSLASDRAAALAIDEVASYHLIDGPGNDPRDFRFAVADLIRLARTRPPALVHCHAGRSRSAVVVAGYLMAERGIGPAAALALIAARREVAVTPELLLLLEGME